MAAFFQLCLIIIKENATQPVTVKIKVKIKALARDTKFKLLRYNSDLNGRELIRKLTKLHVNGINGY